MYVHKKRISASKIKEEDANIKSISDNNLVDLEIDFVIEQINIFLPQ